VLLSDHREARSVLADDMSTVTAWWFRATRARTGGGSGSKSRGHAASPPLTGV